MIKIIGIKAIAFSIILTFTIAFIGLNILIMTENNQAGFYKERTIIKFDLIKESDFNIYLPILLNGTDYSISFKNIDLYNLTGNTAKAIINYKFVEITPENDSFSGQYLNVYGFAKSFTLYADMDLPEHTRISGEKDLFSLNFSNQNYYIESETSIDITFHVSASSNLCFTLVDEFEGEWGLYVLPNTLIMNEWTNIGFIEFGMVCA